MTAHASQQVKTPPSLTSHLQSRVEQAEVNRARTQDSTREQQEEDGREAEKARVPGAAGGGPRRKREGSSVREANRREARQRRELVNTINR